MPQRTGAIRRVQEAKLPHHPVARETVQDRVYRELRAMILNGELAPGQTLTIQGLARSFQVSAMPVREALSRLTAEQAMTVLAGRSVGIPELTQARLADLTRVRREVEGLAVAWAAARISTADLARLTGLVARMQLAAEQRDGRRYVPANHDFHFIIYRAADSQVLLGIIESLWLQIGPYFHVLRASDNWHAANVTHRSILAALEGRDGTLAAQALAQDVDQAALALRALIG